MSGAPSSLLSQPQPEIWLTAALDCRAVSEWLSRNGCAVGPLLDARVVEHTPGKRAVIAYRSADPERGPGLIGKVYADPARPVRLHETLTRLDAARPGEWSIPRPVALIPAMSLSLQEAAHGVSLDRTPSGDRRRVVCLAARWLGTLHGLDLAFARTWNPVSEMRKVSEWAELVSSRHPSLATQAAELCAWLRASIPVIDQRECVPVHKDFRFQHVLFDGTRVTVIDLDEVRGGDPALDSAHFCAYLELLAQSWGEPEAARHLASAFLDEYELQAPARARRDAQHRYYYAYACLKMGKQLVGATARSLVPGVTQADRLLRHVLREGLRCAED